MIGWLCALAALDVLLLAAGDRQAVIPDVWFVPLHVAMTALALVLCLREMLAKGSMGPTKLLIGAAFGPVGILAVAVAKPFEWTRRRRRKLSHIVLKDGAREVQPLNATASMLTRTLDDRVSYPEPDQLASLRSTLRYGDLASRHKALQAVVRSFEPQLSPLIALALTDSDQTLRALAAAASAQINYEVAGKFNEMETKVSQQLGVEETLPVVMAIASHGLHNILLSGSQRLRLIKTAHQYLSAVAGQLAHDRSLRKHVAQLHEETTQAIVKHHADTAAGPAKIKRVELVS